MLLHYLTEYQTLAYWIIFFGMMIEGDIFLFTAGFLTYQGYFDIGIAFFLLFLGAIMGDNIWYVIGESAAIKNNFFARFINRVTKHFDEHLKKHPARVIFVSKFAYGLHRPIILKAGAERLPFKKFIEADIITTIVWIFLIGGLGYLSSASFLLIKRYLRYTELTLFLGIAIFILISHFITKISKKEV